MIWLFGLITMLSFDMPTWWFILGFILAVLDDKKYVIRYIDK